MDLSSLIKQVYNNRPISRHSSNNYSLESGNSIFDTSIDLYGDKDYTFYILLINLLDRAIIEDNLHVMSVEQQKLIEEYFKEEDINAKLWNATSNEVLNNLDMSVNTDNKNNVTPIKVYEFYNFSTLPKHIRLLDEFLGSYMGEENEQFSRYGKEQFYSKYQPFGP